MNGYEDVLQYLSNKGAANIKASTSMKATFQSNQACVKYEITVPETVFITYRIAGQARRDAMRHRRIAASVFKRSTHCWASIEFSSTKKKSAPLKAYFPPRERALVSVKLT